MSRRLTLALAAFAIGLGTMLVPSVAPVAHAGISVPLPPPSLAPPPTKK